MALKCYSRFDHSFQDDEQNSMAAYMVSIAAKVLHMFEYLGFGILSQGNENDVREGCA
jgi:hypothetical protein